MKSSETKSKIIKTKSDNKTIKKKKMLKSGSSASPSSPRKSKTLVINANEEEVSEMPILTPEAPILSPEIDIDSNADIDLQIPSMDVSFLDLVPPVLSPALDEGNKPKNKNIKNSVKNKSKRKSKVQQNIQDFETDLYNFSLNDYNDNGFESEFARSPKKKLKTNKTFNKNMISPKKSQNKLLQNSINKSIKKSKGKLYNCNNNNNSFSSSIMQNSPKKPNGWSLDSNHTMTSTNSSAYPIMQSFLNNTNNNYSFDRSDCSQTDLFSFNNNDNGFGLNFKPKKSKLFKKSNKTFENQSNKSAKSSLFNELIGVKKPEAEIDEIEGVVFQSFDSEESINLFTKFETLERDQQTDESKVKNYRIKSFKSGKVIFPTKTKDITKIKGWREKLFSSIDEPMPKRQIISSTSKGSQSSAFVSDLLDGYLKNKSDLKMNYLSEDLAPPPDDSPIFSASVLKMPDFNASEKMPAQSTSTSSCAQLTIKRKSNFGRSKGLKNKLSLKPDFSDTFDFLDDDDDKSYSEKLLPQYPIIREPQWPESHQNFNNDHFESVYKEYIAFTHNESQMLKKYNPPSFIMDDLYARYALSALQCNERISFVDTDSKNNDNVLFAVGLAPKPQEIKEASPVKEVNKITGRYRKEREADLAKIIAMGNRSKRQIRLPSRFHESSLLMGNQWVIPDYDQNVGKTGKRRLIQEQKRLQALHQRQLELDQRNLNAHINDPIDVNSDETPPLTLIRSTIKKQGKTPKTQKLLKTKSNSIPMSSDYPIKIPQQRLKQLQIARNQKNINNSANSVLPFDKSFTSLYSLSTKTKDDKRHVSLSAKAAASASQRAVVNQLFCELFDVISPEERNLFSKNGKINKLEVIKKSVEIIEKLKKRDQQLNYIKKLLSMWNHKLVLCSKVISKDVKPEAHKVVNEIMNTYKNSMCYKVGEALDAKRKEYLSQQKNLQPMANQKSDNINSHQMTPHIINIPTAHSSLSQFKRPKPVKQRKILPKNAVKVGKGSKKSETVSSPNKYPTLTTPDVLQRNIEEYSVDSDFSVEGSLLKPPILTTRPTVLKPFIYNTDGLQKDQNLQTSKNRGVQHSNPELESHSSKGKIAVGINAFIPISSASNITGVTTSTVTTSNGQSKALIKSNPNSFGAKSVIISSETPLDTEDLSKIVASITNNPDIFKKVPVRLSNGMSALTIPGPIDMPFSAKLTNYTSTTTSSQSGFSQSLMVRSKGTNITSISDKNEESLLLKNRNNSGLSQTQNINVSTKPLILHKQMPKLTSNEKD